MRTVNDGISARGAYLKHLLLQGALIRQGRLIQQGRLLNFANFSAYTDDLRVATVLSAEILKIKNKYTHFELAYTEAKIIKRPILKLFLVFLVF